jgi:hypothetical protein
VKRAMFATLVLGALTPHAFAQSSDEALAGDPPPVSQDDIAQAADATAEVAGVAAQPATVDPATPDAAAAPASTDDIDLGSLGLDPAGTSFDDKLNIYGFADFAFWGVHWSRELPYFPQNAKTFGVGNLNIYLARNLTERARALAEVRFTFLPNGSQNPDGSFVDSTAYDPYNYGRPVQIGSIVIERVYAEYDLQPNLTLRAGHWLTPYGIWNVDHGSPVIIGADRPYIIGEKFFPEHQTGLHLFGTHHHDGFKLEGHLTASNGRGGSEAQIDIDGKLAFGGRLHIETPWGLKVGGSYYRGRYTGFPASPTVPGDTYLEAAYGGDVQFDRGGIHLQGEAILRERHYPIGQRTQLASGFAPDARDFGFYALASYRFDRFWSVTPYYLHEGYWPADHTFFERLNFADTVGLNFRPSPNLVLKAYYAYVTFVGAGFLGDMGLTAAGGQVSWVF